MMQWIGAVLKGAGRTGWWTLRLLRPRLNWRWMGSATLVLGASGFGFMEYTARPEFCLSCHIMEPYYHSWLQSSHKDVACTDCHFEPGFRGMMEGKFKATVKPVKYLTGAYGSKPNAQVSDRSCLRDGCHEHRLLDGQIAWQVPSERGGQVVINFDHTPHLSEDRRGKEMRCVSCHSQMVQGAHMAVTVDTCFLCHFKGFEHGRNDQTPTGCQGCHAAPQREIRLVTGTFNHGEYIERGVACENCHSDSIVGDGEVPRQVCWVCHNLPSQVARYDETDFIHQTHISEHKVRCSNCHLEIQHSLTAAADAAQRRMPYAHGSPMGFAGDCAQCHERMHLGPKEMYQGIGGVGVADMPSSMFRAQVDCIACHRQREEGRLDGRTWFAGQEACDHCHGSRYDGTLDVWRQTIETQLAEAQAALREAEGVAASLSGPAARRAAELLTDARLNITFVQRGRGVHNVTYATALLSVAQELCQDVRRLADGPPAVAGGDP